MLSSISLNNVALIKKQTIPFDKGFNCLLGQSGAGKSLIISALDFSLGAKADKNLIRSGESSLRVDAVFDNLGEEACSLLQELEIEVEDELILTRTLNSDGKSSIKINGFPVTAKTLKDLSSLLVDFCGQHDSVGLLNVNNHLSLLDKFAGEEVESLKRIVEGNFERLKDIQKRIDSLGGNETERERTKDLLSYQIQEIEKADLKIGEDVELKEKFDFMSASEEIFDKLSQVLAKLDGFGQSVCPQLFDSKNLLGDFANFKDIEDCRQRIENSYYDMKDVFDTLEGIRDGAEYDPKELERIDGRLDQIKGLKKKYGASIEAILNHLTLSKNKLDELENSEVVLSKLIGEKKFAEKELESSCQTLSEVRQRYAKVLEHQLMMQLDDLQMKGTFFKVNFERGDCSKKGFDCVKFMFSANKGQDLRDLHKTASGGELSRLLLAFKNVMLEKESVQTVVFDEIDAGISGETAGKLAQKLYNISKFTQIICITHTAVVASKANNFLRVEKIVDDLTTTSIVKQLDEQETIFEIARLIDGGKEVSNTAIEHAKKLLIK